MVMMLVIGFICAFTAKDTFTGGNEELKSVLGLFVRTMFISFVFNLGWLAASVLSHNEELSIIHPQYWALITYGMVIAFTYFFWVKQIINNIIKPSIEKVRSTVKEAGSYGNAIKQYAGKVKTRFGGGSGEPNLFISKPNDSVASQNTSTLTNQKDYLAGLSTYDRYHSDPDFFRNSAYDFKHQSTNGNFYSEDYKESYNEELGRSVKTSR